MARPLLLHPGVRPLLWAKNVPNDIFPSQFGYLVATTYALRAKEDVLSNISGKAFMEKVIKKLILRIDKYKAIPEAIDSHFIYNIPNYLTGSELQEIPIIKNDPKAEKLELDISNAYNLCRTFTSYLNAVSDETRFEMVKQLFFHPFVCSSRGHPLRLTFLYGALNYREPTHPSSTGLHFESVLLKCLTDFFPL